MFTPRPLVFYDVNRISASDAHKFLRMEGTWIPVSGDPHKVAMVVGGGVPTPDELFRWTPKEQK